MRKILLVAVAVVTILLTVNPAIAYWNGPLMAPPPIPRPPGGFGMMPSPGWSMGHRTYPSASGGGAEGSQRQVPTRAAQSTQAVAPASEAQEARLAAQQAFRILQAEHDRLRAECTARESQARPASATVAAESARPEVQAVEHLSAELAQVRSELMASTRRVHDLIAERDELKAQFGSNMGDVASVRNAFEQVRKRAVEVGTALSDSQGTDVGGGFEREFLKADLDRLIAALALADAVLSEAATRARASAGSGGALRTGDWQGRSGEADLIEAASFEADR